MNNNIVEPENADEEGYMKYVSLMSDILDSSFKHIPIEIHDKFLEDVVRYINKNSRFYNKCKTE